MVVNDKPKPVAVFCIIIVYIMVIGLISYVAYDTIKYIEKLQDRRIEYEQKILEF